MIPLTWKLTLSPDLLWLLIPLSQQAKEAVMMLAGVNNPDYQGEIGLLLHNGGNEEYAWKTRVCLTASLRIAMSLLRSMGNYNNPTQAR